MRRRLLLIAALLVLAWGVYAAVSLALVASDLQAGRDAASGARDQLGAEEVADGEPLPELAEAAGRFGDADARVGSFLLSPLRLLPVVGRQLRSVDALAGAAAEVAETGVEAIERAQVVLDDPAGGGMARVEQARSLREIVADVAEQLEAIDDLGPLRGLVGPLADARNELAADLLEAQQTIDDARVGADAVLSLLEGPRRYLVVAANNAEMRAGSGTWLQGGVLTTGDGELDLGEMRPLADAYDPPDDAVELSGDLADRWGFLNPQREWRNLMASPRFPQSAELALRMYEAATGEVLDGVLLVDVLGLQALVEATGPVTVDDRELTADDIPEELLHGQYLAYGDLIEDYEQNVERREVLARIAEAAVGRLDEGGWDTSAMLQSMATAVRGRHLLAWSPDTVELAGWEAAGMTGELAPDALLVSVLNRGVNKLDWFLDVGAELAVDVGEERTEVAVELTLRNTTPEGEPSYVAGPRPELGLAYGEYRGILAVNVPGAASRARFDDGAPLVVAGPDGPTRVVGLTFRLAAGEERRHTLRFSVPKSSSTSLTVMASSRVPGVTWRYEAEQWEDSEPHAANW